MSYLNNKENYLAQIDAFIQNKISAVDFQQCFTSLWKADRDEQFAVRNTWPRRFDLELDEALKKGSLSEAEYLRKSAALWDLNTEEKRTFVALLDQVFSACDCFIGDSSLSIDASNEYTEIQLRDFIAATLDTYKKVKK